MYRFLHKEIVGIYITYEQKTKSYHLLLNESINLVKKLIAFLLGTVVLTVISVIGVPILYQVAFNQRIFIMPFFFPYLDYNTDLGYYLTSTFHVICVVFGGMGNFISDSWCFVFAAHIPLIKNILKAKFDELDKVVNEKPKVEKDVWELLIEIFKWHQKYLM